MAWTKETTHLTNLVVEGTLAVAGGVTLSGAQAVDSLTVGGGYGTTGATLSTAGVGQFNGALSSDGAVTSGKSGVAGSVEIYPTTASKGKVAITCANQTGNTTVALTVDAMAAARTIHLPDPGATSYLMQSTAQITLAEADVLDAVTPGTGAASKALVLNATADITAGLRNLAITGTLACISATVTATSASTSGSVSVEPMIFSSTMTGPGGVGGRARFQLDTNVALGDWCNALKAYTKFGATGRITGLASAFCAELELSAGTTEGNYAPLESEIVIASGASTGAATAFIYGNVAGTGIATFNTNGFLLTLGAGVTSTTDGIFEAESKTAIAKTHTLRINVGGTAYFIPLHTAKACGGS